MVNETRAMYGESFGIQAVPAFMTTIGTLALVTSGALAIAFGEKTNPVRMSTPSRVTSSCTAFFAMSPPGRLESRLMSSTV